jgi:hypothetical protein
MLSYRFIDPKRGSVLEKDAELLAHLVEALLPQSDDLVAIDPDLTPFGAQQSEDVLEQHGLPRTGRPKDRRDPPLRDVKGDVLENGVGAEGFRDATERDDRSPGAIQPGPVVSCELSI